MNTSHPSVLDPFYARFACKAYDPSKKISDEDFHTILEAGRLSPSSFGLEPWKFLVVENQALKDKLFPLGKGIQASLAGADRFVIILARKRIDLLADSAYVTHMLKEIHQLPEDAYTARHAYYKNFQTHDFPVAANEDATFQWACRQTYIALGNMLTVAAALGIDSCALEGYKHKEVEELLISEGCFDPVHFGVSLMVSFGHAAPGHRHDKTRQPLEDVVEYLK